MLDEAARLVWHYRRQLQPLLREVTCLSCQGSRLRPEAAATRFAGLTLGQLNQMTIGEVERFFRDLELTPSQQHIAGEAVRQIRQRLHFLVEVGLDYLTLGRPGPTLSGGEAQRIRLAAQVGSGLTGVLYVLDEPTIGLHPRDNQRLLQSLQRLRDLGNTLIVVEHDREVIQAADFVLDFGPGAGREGGQIVAAAHPRQLADRTDSLTGNYLAARQAIPLPSRRRTPDQRWLRLRGARRHNLRHLDVDIPLGLFVAVTGVSGSGKSTLIRDVLQPALALRLHGFRTLPSDAPCQSLEGCEYLDKVITVDQDPLGSSPASNPATYTGVFNYIRELFARLPEAKVRGYTPGRFSLHIPGGRCDDCEGLGQKRIEMHFLPDVWIPCETCGGKRYNPETLAITYRGKNIADVLDMPIRDALGLFADQPKIARILQLLVDVGLGYLALGQSAATLSGGEAQRVKLAAELARPAGGHTLYLLDEPTTGLHFDDIRKLLDVLHRLVDAGHSVIVIEHNLDVIKTADWIIDLGPEAGAGGGRLVASGPPEDIVRQFRRGAPTHTGRFLAPLLPDSTISAADRPAPIPPDQPNGQVRSRHQTNLLQPVADDQTTSLRLPSAVEKQMPWMRQWQSWHTGPKGFPPDQPRAWPPLLLDRLLALFRQLPDNELTVESRQHFLAFRAANGNELCRLYTKQPEALVLECMLPAHWWQEPALSFWTTLEGATSERAKGRTVTIRFALRRTDEVEQFRLAELVRLLAARRGGNASHREVTDASPQV